MNFEIIANSKQYLGEGFLLQFIGVWNNFQSLLETADTIISEISKEIQNKSLRIQITFSPLIIKLFC